MKNKPVHSQKIPDGTPDEFSRYRTRDDRKEIVLGWFMRAEQFWILARVGEHDFHFDSCAWHIHALAVEMMIKTAILTVDPRAGSWKTFKSHDIFKEKHDVVRLLHRWNRADPEHAILPESVWCLHSVFSDDGKTLVESPDSFGYLGMYLSSEMIGRYNDGVLKWDRAAFQAANIVFFRLRNYIKQFLQFDMDVIDRAINGCAGRTEKAQWLSRAVRKSNPGLPSELVIVD